jgi:hypothetical protein
MMSFVSGLQSRDLFLKYEFDVVGSLKLKSRQRTRDRREAAGESGRDRVEENEGKIQKKRARELSRSCYTPTPRDRRFGDMFLCISMYTLCTLCNMTVNMNMYVYVYFNMYTKTDMNIT